MVTLRACNHAHLRSLKTQPGACQNLKKPLLNKGPRCWPFSFSGLSPWLLDGSPPCILTQPSFGVCLCLNLLLLKEYQSCWIVCLCAQWCPTLSQAPVSMELSRQEYWSQLPFASPGDLPDPETESPALAGRLFTSAPPVKL